MNDDEAVFILQPAERPPLMDEEGKTIISDGAVGRIGKLNAYLTIYAGYPEKDDRLPADLAVGDVIRGVRYSMSGGVGLYDVWRVA